MENCFLKEFKKATGNEALLKLGHMRIEILGGTVPGITINYSSPDADDKIEIVGGGAGCVFSDTNNKYHAIPLDKTNPTSGEYSLDFNKYKCNIVIISATGIPAQGYDNIQFNIEDLAYNPEFKHLECRSQMIYGSIDAFSGKFTKLRDLDINFASKITGDLSSLMNCFDDSERLKSGITTDVPLLLYNTGITGNLKALLDHIASFAFNGNRMLVNVGNTAIDTTGVSALATGQHTIVFDGAGSYTIDPT